MSVFKELVLSKEEDKKSLVKKLYRFSEDLKFTLSNLDEDNFSRSFLDWESEKKSLTRTIKHDADELQIKFEDLEADSYGQLEQSAKSIKLLVNRGSVVETMLSRMELYGEHIDLKTGHVTIDANNMKLDAAGNATFSGAITGGTMNLGNNFAVDASGHAVLQGDLRCNLLNPKKKTTVGGDVTVEGSEGYGGCTVGRTLTGSEAYIVDSLSCKKVTETSDARVKMDVTTLSAPDMTAICPVSWHFKATGKESIGFIAQELDKPVRRQKSLRVEYGEMGAMWVAAIQDNQRRIDRIRGKIEGRE